MRLLGILNSMMKIALLLLAWFVCDSATKKFNWPKAVLWISFIFLAALLITSYNFFLVPYFHLEKAT